MYYYGTVDILNQLRHLGLGYLGMENKLSNVVNICLPISEANYTENEQEWYNYFWKDQQTRLYDKVNY